MDLFDLLLDNQDAPAEQPTAPAATTRPQVRSTPPSASDPARLLSGLNPEQARAVQHVNGPLLILAGAGSGKTRVITHRIAYLVEVHKISPAAILAITFTNKAAAEMKSRIEDLVGSASSAMWIGTFHSMLARILRRFADRLGYERNFSIIDSDDQQKVVKQCLAELKLDEKTFAVRSVHAQISSAKNALQTPADFAREAGSDYRASKVAEVYRLYQDKLKRANSMDFDDILLEAVRLLENQPDILAEYQNRFRYILVDEYQDTNHAQYKLVQMLSAGHRNLCVVGDDDQSIYSFRGANIQNILDFEKDFKGCTVIKLEQNYRSTGNVLGAANEVIRNNAGRKNKKLWTEAHAGEKITFLRAESHSDESRYIASEISRLATGQQYRYGDIAILYRLNALSRNLEGALRDEGVPYRIFGGMRFYDRKEIKDVLAYLRLIAFPKDDLSLGRIINVPRRGIGDATLETLAQLAAAHQVSQLEICTRAQEFPELARTSGRLLLFASMVERLRQGLLSDQMSFPEYIEWVENESGLVQDILDQQEKSKADSVDRIENLKELLSDAVEFDQNRRNQIDQMAGSDLAQQTGVEEDHLILATTLPDILNAFLERAALYSEMDNDAGEQDYVRLMTIHSAKGLEFKAVFLVGAEEGLFPGYRSMASEADIEEERRLAYVAITRAQEKLYVTTARSRLVFGQTQSLMVSRFIREIPDEYMDERGGSRRGDRSAEFGESAGWGRGEGSTRSQASQSIAGGYPDFPAVSGKTPKIENPFVTTTPARRGPASSPVQPSTGPAIAAAPGATGPHAASPAKKGIEPASVQPGDRVRHSSFGEGKVIRVDPVAGDAILLIEFGKVGQKRMLARQASLEKL
ncbi:MAG: UvrD-helicase domain-containing protein [Eubacteriales bacterium]|nr:UvrD-helicase domain-containing protein [Eubacteriales bacterium]